MYQATPPSNTHRRIVSKTSFTISSFHSTRNSPHCCSVVLYPPLINTPCTPRPANHLRVPVSRPGSLTLRFAKAPQSEEKVEELTVLSKDGIGSPHLHKSQGAACPGHSQRMPRDTITPPAQEGETRPQSGFARARREMENAMIRKERIIKVVCGH
ncbi:hypothetical protein BU23DRAFT_159887 [Bimuria novae-zelandiae CBS 107.79]|uniref:Uncharacterized protein n=1 Tax=Bimuria novae-zelandiae CBS 107.79 TaxID=1447943 RepID=A0A6A5V5K9_9PLEO|nr:hypothetical protein BU23DRAFT_159887 [Bimuria novae-zelandiae CBS 107.79]